MSGTLASERTALRPLPPSLPKVEGRGGTEGKRFAPSFPPTSNKIRALFFPALAAAAGDGRFPLFRTYSFPHFSPYVQYTRRLPTHLRTITHSTVSSPPPPNLIRLRFLPTPWPACIPLPCARGNWCDVSSTIWNMYRVVSYLPLVRDRGHSERYDFPSKMGEARFRVLAVSVLKAKEFSRPSNEKKPLELILRGKDGMEGAKLSVSLLVLREPLPPLPRKYEDGGTKEKKRGKGAKRRGQRRHSLASSFFPPLPSFLCCPDPLKNGNKTCGFFFLPSTVPHCTMRGLKNNGTKQRRRKRRMECVRRIIAFPSFFSGRIMGDSEKGGRGSKRGRRGGGFVAEGRKR